MTLALQVATRNKVNSKANYVCTYLLDLFARYEGKRIVKFTPYKTFTAQIKKEIYQLQQRLAEQKFRLIFDFGCGFISAELDTTYPVSEYSVNYVKQVLCLASYACETGVVNKLHDIHSFRSDYTEQEIINKRERLAFLDREMSELQGELRRFNR
jgi:trans-aconitate methyltransferase